MTPPAPKPLSVSTSPSIGPAAARAAAQDAQIAQLVQQNQDLEQIITKLQNQLRAEEARGADSVGRIREKWKAENREWRRGCDALQARHRLAHLGTRMALEHERGLRLEDKEALLREKTETLLREYKITLFQAKESDFVMQMAALEDEIQSQREERAELVSKHEAELARVTSELAKADVCQQETAEQTNNFEQERRVLETEMATLRTASAASVKQIDRLTLQIETLRTQNATLEAHNRELQLQEQKWQTLKGSGDKEVESLRNNKVELESRLKELEATLKESHTIDKKISRLETSLLETQEQVEQAHQDIGEAHAETAKAKKHVLKLEVQIEKLKAALEAEKAKSIDASKKSGKTSERLSKTSNKPQRRAPSVIEEIPEPSEDDVEERPPLKSPLKRHKPSSHRSDKGKDKEKAINTSPKDKDEAKERVIDGGDVEYEDGEIVEIEHDKDTEAGNKDDVLLQPSRTRPRRQVQDSDTERATRQGKRSHFTTLGQANKDNAKPPRSRTDKNSDTEEDERPKRRGRSKPPSTISDQRKQSDADTDKDLPLKKKKRKLNVTGGTSVFGGPAGFTWDQGGGADLGIPSVLSPVKEGQPVPARSTSSSILGGWKMW